MEKIQFQKGSFALNDDSNFNFQLNRTVMWDGGDINDIKAVSHKIKDSESWKKEMIELGDKAKKEGRIKEAIAYYRMSEFFMYDGDVDKIKYYLLATELFYEYYHDYFKDGEVQRFNVPYENVYLPVMFVKAIGERKDTILLHGGNDSYYEEFFFPMLYFAQNGFDVYLFEGPGQGGVMRVQGKHFTHEWEKPVKAILDFFDLNDVTIIGASLGGMLAPRAAAFDKRIGRVIAWSVFTNFMDVLISTQPPAIKKLTRFCLKFHLSFFINFAFNHKAKRGNELVKWGLSHGMYAYEARSPCEYIKKIEKYQITNVGDKIDQDILIIGASKDHFIDYKTVGTEIEALTNVKSLSVRIFTEKENGEGHCNVGNPKLCFDTMINWMEQIKQRDKK